MAQRKILVSTKFIQATQAIQNYLSEYSDVSADKFTKSLKAKILKVVKHPEGYPPVRELPTKKNWYSYALFQKHYKIIYKVTAKKLVLLTIAHTKQNPDRLKDLRTSDYS